MTDGEQFRSGVLVIWMIVTVFSGYHPGVFLGGLLLVIAAIWAGDRIDRRSVE